MTGRLTLVSVQTANALTDQVQVTHDQARHLAALMHALRPDWTQKAILTAIYAARGRCGNFDLVAAAIRYAASGQSPEGFVFGGSHWETDEPAPPRRRVGVSVPLELCTRCRTPHRLAEACDVLPSEVADAATARAAIAQARAALRGDA